MLVSVPVSDVMTRDVETVAPDVSVRAVARTLDEENVTSAVVCAEDRPVGIVTESDLVRVLADERDPDAVTVEDVMSADLVTAAPDTSVEEAARLFAEGDFRRLPVVADGALVGIVTVTDLSYYLPHLVRGRRTPGERGREHPPATTDEMAYEDSNWQFEHVGEDERRVDVGDVVRFRKTLAEDDVEAFAAASGDTNRLHLDEAFAARSRFGGRIVHGVLTASLISAALARLPGLTIYLSQDLSFTGPADVGETLTAVCEVVENLGGGKYELATAVVDEDGETIVEGRAVVLVDTLPDAEGEHAARPEGEANGEAEAD